MLDIYEFLRESNEIEGIRERVPVAQIDMAKEFIELPYVQVSDVCNAVNTFQLGAKLRLHYGMDVWVGNHEPPVGGPHIGEHLKALLDDVPECEKDVYFQYHEYETLHPFMDGNGRSGRLLWLRSMNWLGLTDRVVESSFLKTWHYQSLAYGGGQRV